MATNNIVNNFGGGSGGPSVYFQAYYSADSGTVTGDGTQYTPIWDTVNYNVGSAYNNLNGIFTAPSAGVYVFNINTFIYGLTASHVNGSFFASGSVGIMQQDIFNGNPAIMRGLAPIGYDQLCINGSLQLPLALNEYLVCVFEIDSGAKTVGIGGITSSGWTSCISGYKLA